MIRAIHRGHSGGGVAVMTPTVKLLALTFVGVFMEITYCTWALVHSGALWVVPLILGAYHGGYLLARLTVLEKCDGHTRLLLVMSTLTLAFGTYVASWSTIAVSMLLFSASLQVLRRALKGQAPVSSWQKNVTKALAMVSGAAGALAPPWLPVLVALTAGALAVVGHGVSGEPLRSPRHADAPVQQHLLWFELLHHAHYFAYCYTFWALLDKALIPFVGPLFLSGWLGYFVLERWLRESSQRYSTTLLALGHVVCAAALGGMLVLRSAPAILALWLVTGIGGGTAYMLGNTPNGGDRELYEDLGHIIGCFGAALVIVITGEGEAAIVLGMVLAHGATLTLAVRSPHFADLRERRYEDPGD